MDIQTGVCCPNLMTDNYIQAYREGIDAAIDAGLTFDFGSKELNEVTKNPTWSEEDEGFLDSALWYIQNSITNGKIKAFVECPLSTWLKSLKNRVKPQKQQVWSEEDVVHLTNAVIAAKEQWGTENRTVKWLKSLEYRYTWKPSDKQMGCLCEALNKSNGNVYDGLKSLFDELQNLK